MDPALPRTERIRTLERVGRRAVLTSALLGAITGFLIVIVAFAATPLEPGAGADIWDHVLFYTIIFGGGGFLTAIELFLIYAVTMRTAREIAILAGMRPAEALDDEAEASLLLTLNHAGLEAPNSTSSLHGIDPIISIPRWRLIFAAAAYKAKVSATKLLMKALWRRIVVRVLGRSASRAVIEIVSIPVFAGWNAIVTRRVMLELRVRALGPETVRDAIAHLYPEGFGAVDDATRVVCLMAVRSQITGVADFHPNVADLLDQLVLAHGRQPADLDGDGEVDDGERRAWMQSAVVDHSTGLEPRNHLLVVRTFAMACALDGRLRPSHRKTLRRLVGADDDPRAKTALREALRFVRKGELPAGE